MNTYETHYDNDGQILQGGGVPPYAAIPQTEGNPPWPVSNTDEPITARYILERINAIAADTAHIREALSTLKDLREGEGPNGIGVQGKANAIAQVVKCREDTNRQILHMLEKMYDFHHVPPVSASPANRTAAAMEHFEKFSESLRKFADEDGNYPGEVLETLQNVSQQIFNNM